MDTVVSILAIVGVGTIGAFVGIGWAAIVTPEPTLDEDPGLVARQAQADIAADVRRAEEQISRLNQPPVSRPRLS